MGGGGEECWDTVACEEGVSRKVLGGEGEEGMGF